jgi:predicted TIM-barrel fold metal-dependent hydrolase
MLKRTLVSFSLAILALAGCTKQPPAAESAASPASPVVTASGGFTAQELTQFAALGPIDTHAHFFQSAPVLTAMLQRLNLHVVNILVALTEDQKQLDQDRTQGWDFVHSSDGHAVLCTTFNPFPYAEPGFSRKAIAEINQDFDRGAIAVKIWKNIGERLKDKKGNYILPDNAIFEPIYKDIAAHDKTLIAHIADPDSIWQAPNKDSADYHYYTQNPEWYMYGRKDAPSKQAILAARDHLLEQNPKLRVVGAHLGSMESNFAQLGQHLDKYPNFAVDMAARMPYIVAQPHDEIVAFLTRYQDRLIYATDDEIPAGSNPDQKAQELEAGYALDWRFFATSDTISYRGHIVKGLALPEPVLRKIYHDNAVHWFPGVLAKGAESR